MNRYQLFEGTECTFEILELSCPISLFVYVERGIVKVRMSDQCMTIKRGQGAIINSVDHICSEDFKGMIITIDDLYNDQLVDWCGSSIIDLFTESFLFTPDSRLRRIFEDLNNIPCINKSAYVKLKALEVLLCLESEKKNMLTKDLSGSQMQVAIMAHQKICEDCLVKVGDLSAALHVSTSYVQKAFKTIYGVSVTTFIRQRIMQQAAHYLKHTNDSVLDIALACGYQNPSKFSQAFSKMMGETPLCYRKSHREYLGAFSN